MARHQTITDDVVVDSAHLGEIPIGGSEMYGESVSSGGVVRTSWRNSVGRREMFEESISIRRGPLLGRQRNQSEMCGANASLIKQYGQE